VFVVEQGGFPGLDQANLLELMEWLDQYNEMVRVYRQQTTPAPRAPLTPSTELH
jgi:hypothetical protein